MQQQGQQQKTSRSGQSLAEFAIGFPILVLLMTAGFYVGMGMYEGQMASDAISGPTMHKFEMADRPGAVSDGELLTMTRMNTARGNLSSGSSIDKVDVKSSNNHTAIILGTRTYDNPFVPLTFTVSQGIQKSLLEANTAGGESKTAMPALKTPPWQAAPELKRSGGYWPCTATSSYGKNEVEAVRKKTGEDTYLNQKSFSANAHAPREVVMSFIDEFMGKCANIDGGMCQQEYEDFKPHDDEDDYSYGAPADALAALSYTKWNPPGMPGYFFRVTMYVPKGSTTAIVEKGTADDGSYTMPIPEVRGNPEHGWYIDPSGAYEKPPKSMVASCKSYRQAECALDAATRRADQIWNSFKQYCD